MTQVTNPELAHVLRRVTVDSNGCWIWLGAKRKSDGYGHIQVNKKQYSVHRYVYTLVHGPESVRGKVLDHLCRVRWCCNPEHLEPVSQRVNVERGLSHVVAFMHATHCIHGHEFNAENTRITARGRRHCRICCRANQRRSWARKKAQR